MAKKGAQKTNLEANEIFLQYEEEIVNDPVYADMPDLRHDDGTIQWEAPSLTEVLESFNFHMTNVINGGLTKPLKLE